MLKCKMVFENNNLRPALRAASLLGGIEGGGEQVNSRESRVCLPLITHQFEPDAEINSAGQSYSKRHPELVSGTGIRNAPAVVEKKGIKLFYLQNNNTTFQLN